MTIVPLSDFFKRTFSPPTELNVENYYLDSWDLTHLGWRCRFTTGLFRAKNIIDTGVLRKSFYQEKRDWWIGTRRTQTALIVEVPWPKILNQIKQRMQCLLSMNSFKYFTATMNISGRRRVNKKTLPSSR